MLPLLSVGVEWDAATPLPTQSSTLLPAARVFIDPVDSGAIATPFRLLTRVCTQWRTHRLQESQAAPILDTAQFDATTVHDRHRRFHGRLQVQSAAARCTCQAIRRAGVCSWRHSVYETRSRVQIEREGSSGIDRPCGRQIQAGHCDRSIERAVPAFEQ